MPNHEHTTENTANGDEHLAINALLLELTQFETLTPPHPHVQEALGIIKEVLLPYKDALIQTRTVVFYYGSLQYNDPVNLDVDISLVRFNYFNLPKLICSRVDLQFSTLNSWPKTAKNNGRCSAHPSSANLDEIELLLETYSQKKDWKYMEESDEHYDPNDQEEFDLAITDMSIVLTGALLYPVQHDVRDMLRDHVRNMISDYPIAQSPLRKQL